MIQVTFNDPISLKEYTARHMGTTPFLPPSQHTTQAPSFMIPAAVQAASKQTLVPAISSSQLTTAGAAATTSSSSSSSVIPYDPIHNIEHRKYYNRKLAYTIVYQMSCASEAMPTHLVATLVLMYRQGITRAQLVSKVEWLRLEVISRGGRVAGFECEERSQLVENGKLQAVASI